MLVHRNAELETCWAARTRSRRRSQLLATRGDATPRRRIGDRSGAAPTMHKR
jgi:hypothetical protein